MCWKLAHPSVGDVGRQTVREWQFSALKLEVYAAGGIAEEEMQHCGGRKTYQGEQDARRQSLNAKKKGATCAIV